MSPYADFRMGKMDGNVSLITLSSPLYRPFAAHFADASPRKMRGVMRKEVR